MRKRVIIVGALCLVLLTVWLVRNSRSRQQEAWIYNGNERLVRHYTESHDRHQLHRLGQALGDAGSNAERLFPTKPHNAKVKYIYQFRQGGKTSKLTLYDNHELYINAAGICTKAKLTKQEYHELITLE